MYLGTAIYETLDEHGTLNSYFMAPAGARSVLIADSMRDVAPGPDSAAVDVGPLRLYADREGIGFKFLTSRLGGRAFRRAKGTLSIELGHQGIPIPQNSAGYYGILLPKGFTGGVKLSILVDGEELAKETRKAFLTDTCQVFVSCYFRVHAKERSTSDIQLKARLRNDRSGARGLEHLSFEESFGGYIDGVHETSIANFIRAINRNLGTESPRVFICHSSSDKSHARRLAHALAARRIRVWIDEAEIKVGDSLIEKIEDGILCSRNLIVILTQRSVASRWCKEELRLALVRQIGGEDLKVLPALFEDCAIPGFLREKAYADFRSHDGFDEKVKELADAIG